MRYESDKMQYVSILRVCSMILIVLYHSLCFYVGVWWYLCTIEVPIWKLIAFPVVKVGLTTFVFISGFLYGYMYLERGKYRKVGSFITNKARRLLIPYFFWGILIILLMPVAHVSWINLFTGISHLWFLLMLFEIFVFMAFINKLGIGVQYTKFLDIAIVIMSFILLYAWKRYSSHQHFFGIDNTLYYLPAFFVGFYYAKYRQKMTSVVLASSLLIIGVTLLCILSFYGYHESNTLYRIPALLVSVSAMILLKDYSFSFCQSRIFANLDKNSMGIYIFNQIVVFVLLLIPDINTFLRHHSFVGVFFIFIVSFVVPWLLSNLINKSKYTSFLIG